MQDGGETLIIPKPPCYKKKQNNSNIRNDDLGNVNYTLYLITNLPLTTKLI
jgi:hypothetical protein